MAINQLPERELLNRNMMELKNELEKLKSIFQNGNADEFKKQLYLLKDNFISEMEIKQMRVFIDEMVKEEIEERD